MEPEPSCAELPTDEERLELLSAYLDGLTSPEETDRVEAWLRTDPTCQTLYRQLYTIQHSLHQPSRTAASTQQAEALVSSIWSQVSPSGWQRYGLPSVLTAGAIAALTGLLGPSEANLVVVSPTPAPPQTWEEVAGTWSLPPEEPLPEALQLPLHRPLLTAPPRTQTVSWAVSNR
jgi:anti-sigma factor RsiW